MNWFDTKRIPNTEYEEILKLERAIADLKTQLDNAQATIKEIEQRTYNSEFVIDWDAMRAFSFERTTSGSQPVSIIGYFINTTGIDKNNSVVVLDTETVKEWTLHCSDEQHEKLAMEFKAHLKASK